MKTIDTVKYIESIAPLSLAASWDNSGMQVASIRTNVSHIAVMLDPSPLSIQAAISAGADMILSHHPLLMHPRLPSKRDGYHEVLRLLFSHDIPLYSAHTSLDANLHGPAAWLADKLMLTSRKCLEAVAEHPDGEPHCGFGMVGDLPDQLSYEVFAQKLAGILGKSAWRASGPTPEIVSRVAYCPGSGESMIMAAKKLEADIYITGDVKYHAALETPIRVLDVGHFILEETMMRCLARSMQKALYPITVTFIQAADPFIFEDVISTHS